MSIQESGEMYLETIYVLSQTSDYVRAIDVGAVLGYSKPSVSRAMRILKDRGYISVEPKSGSIKLTDSGRKIAETIYERHVILTKALKLLGIDDKTASEDACRLEHYISDTTFAAIKAHIEERS